MRKTEVVFVCVSLQLVVKQKTQRRTLRVVGNVAGALAQIERVIGPRHIYKSPSHLLREYQLKTLAGEAEDYKRESSRLCDSG